jgi:hypothetical protein
MRDAYPYLSVSFLACRNPSSGKKDVHVRLEGTIPGMCSHALRYFAPNYSLSSPQLLSLLSHVSFDHISLSSILGSFYLF